MDGAERHFREKRRANLEISIETNVFRHLTMPVGALKFVQAGSVSAPDVWMPRLAPREL